MKLLMITRKVDKQDSAAGFTYNWVYKLAAQVDSLEVICLEKGDTEGLPSNCTIHSLQKEQGKNRMRALWLFFKYTFKLVPKVDGVLSHQNPEYGILASLPAKIYRKKIVAWYTHGKVNWKLKLLVMLVDQIITASEDSMRVKTNKKLVLHHGIDTDQFSFQPKGKGDRLELLTVSRLSRSKQVEKMLELVSILKDQLKLRLTIVGGPILESEQKYLQELKQQATELGITEQVFFKGAVPNNQTQEYYNQADIVLNFSTTGSIDKVVLEAMATGTLVLTTNEAFKYFFKNVGMNMYAQDLPGIVEKIRQLMSMDWLPLQESLRELVVQQHNLDKLLVKIVKLYE